MILNVELGPDLEDRLREQAAARGRDAHEYAVELLDQALKEAAPLFTEPNEAEQERLRKSFQEWLKHIETIRPDPNPPRPEGQEAEIHRVVIDHVKKGMGRS